MSISEETYRQVALEDPEGKWELYCGQLRSKPSMTYAHNHAAWFLGVWLQNQLNTNDYEIRVDAGRTQRTSESFFVPDVMVIPKRLTYPLRDLRDVLEVYADPLPLVVEVWSPSTGGYDVRGKLPEYQRGGDAEIWYIHPYDRTLTGVSIDLDALFNV